MSRKCKGKEAMKTDIAIGDCIKRDIENMGEEWKNEQHIQETEDCWERKQWTKSKKMSKFKANKNHGQLTPDDRDAKKRTLTNGN